MARYKIIDRSPRFLPVVLAAQLMSGSFEYALDYLIDHELDLSALDRFRKQEMLDSVCHGLRLFIKHEVSGMINKFKTAITKIVA